MLSADFMASQEPDALEAAIVSISKDAYDAFSSAGFASLYTPGQFIEPLKLLLGNNADKSAEELQKIAEALTPGSVHDNCLIYRMAMSKIAWPCPKLRAAIIAHTWYGGKVGFQHMPNPQTTEQDEYEFTGDLLLDALREVHPEDVLVGEDRAFYDALPERFTVYRGGSGVSTDMIGLGICWTTRRDVAEWFAARGCKSDEAPVLLSARVRKDDVLLAFATEHEVALRPMRWRQLECRRRTKPSWRPKFGWQPAIPLEHPSYDG